MDKGPPNEEIVVLLQGAIRDVRSLAMDLRPSTLDDFGLSATLAQLCREAEQAVGRPISSPRIAVRDQDVPEPLRSVIFRVVQQTLKQLVACNGVRDLRVSLDQERGQGLRLAVAVNASGDCIDDPRISEVWERAVLSGAAYRETRSATGYVRYEATWCL
jgi:signal transduction histidine kinase